ncbi:hypothetical protein BX592_107254 [Paraburkholderia rhizosphaerae]|uniref:Uncharacterized protein n=2 Tax=Paraburkholderia rhizosphaerae TaxID=480658 RepID=A0A4R8LYC6_9BURK|nr:hypothetical protein BX592_107254 [Paraburkholderia rhizosphaerae]
MITALALTISLSSCALLPEPTHNVETETPTYNPSTSARIRVLSSENNRPYAIFRSGSCFRSFLDFDGTRVDDGLAGSFRYSTRSVVIGMPLSPRPWMRPDGLVGKTMVREYVAPAGQPITYSMGWVVDSGQYGTTRRCVPSSMVLTPEAGHDYDVYLEGQGRQCSIVAKQIDGQGLDLITPMSVAPKCSSDR